MTDLLLKVEDLRVHFLDAKGRPFPVIQGLDLEIQTGQTVALTGASGCGKSLTARALCGLLPKSAHSSGRIFWKGEEITGSKGKSWSNLRGGGMTMILQEPATGLNPVLQVGRQIAETWELHHGDQRSLARNEALKLLEEVRISDPLGVYGKYPHQLSGGMKQRILLAAALACEPSLLLADEPTTALDPTVQRSILALLLEIRKCRNMAMIFISHDPDLVKLITNHSYVMKEGQIVPGIFGEESFPAGAVHSSPNLIPETPKPILEAANLVVEFNPTAWGPFQSGRRTLRAVDGVDLTLYPGKAVGLAGESGCGKTSLAKAMARHLAVESGTLTLSGMDFLGAKGETLRKSRRMVQLVFQDPVASLNPRQRIRDILIEAAGDAGCAVEQLLAEVGLKSEVAGRFGHQLSGGQRQRVALARALAVNPAVLIADEVSAALDPVVTRKILGLLSTIMRKRNLAVLLISHDLILLQRWCHEVQVMLGGIILEVFPGVSGHRVVHPYTQELQASMPVALRGEQESLQGEENLKTSAAMPTGQRCPWALSCKVAISSCHNVLPPLVSVAEGCLSRCPVAEVTGPSTFIDT